MKEGRGDGEFCKIKGDNMNVHSYKNSSGKDLILEYIDTLEEEERVDAFSVLELLEQGEFDKIFYKKWEKKIYEVYFRKHNRKNFNISAKIITGRIC